MLRLPSSGVPTSRCQAGHACEGGGLESRFWQQLLDPSVARDLAPPTFFLHSPACCILPTILTTISVSHLEPANFASPAFLLRDTRRWLIRQSRKKTLFGFLIFPSWRETPSTSNSCSIVAISALQSWLGTYHTSATHLTSIASLS